MHGPPMGIKVPTWASRESSWLVLIWPVIPVGKKLYLIIARVPLHKAFIIGLEYITWASPCCNNVKRRLVTTPKVKPIPKMSNNCDPQLRSIKLSEENTYRYTFLYMIVYGHVCICILYINKYINKMNKINKKNKYTEPILLCTCRVCILHMKLHLIPSHLIAHQSPPTMFA
jgi:hypothetical protein